MYKPALVVAALVVIVAILSYFVPAEIQKKNCTYLCSLYPKEGNWNAGPCLAEAGQAGMDKNWVCDVAHEPRQPVDDLPENQCSTYGPGKHFVEVDVGCRFIRAV